MTGQFGSRRGSAAVHGAGGGAAPRTRAAGFLARILLLGLVSTGVVHAGILTYQLHGLGDPVEFGFGATGLYLGPSFSSRNVDVDRFNWEFADNVMLEIDTDSGNASIRGDMIRLSEATGPAWGFDASLTGLVIRNGTGTGTSRHDYNAVSDDIQAMLSGSAEGLGIEWKNIDLEVTSPYDYWGGTDPRSSRWQGLAMPAMGHVNVAELKYSDDYHGTGRTGYVFDAWYQRADCTNCSTRIGDTKSEPIPVPMPIPMPEPPVGLLLAACLPGLAIRRRYRSIRQSG